MALTRKFLAALGIDADKVDEIINAHCETVDALKAERDKFKADADHLAEVQAELNGIKEQAAKNGGKNPFELKYNAIKEEFENYKKDQAAKELTAKKSEAYRSLLKEAGVDEKRIEAVLKVSDVDGIKIGEDGKIEGADALKESIKTEWSDFITPDSGARVDTGAPLSGGGHSITADEIMAIQDDAKRQEAILQNHELFGF